MTTLEFPGLTKLDLPPERILDRAMDAGLETVVVIGFTAEGEFYLASSAADGGNVAWLLTRALHKLHQNADELVCETREVPDTTGDVVSFELTGNGRTARRIPTTVQTCVHGMKHDTCSTCAANNRANLYPV